MVNPYYCRMKKHVILFLFLISGLHLAWSQSAALYDDSRVSRIYLELPADSLQEMIQNLVNDHYYSTTFIFDDGTTRDTVPNVGLRLRGNTSLSAQKKSFKISFNAYEPGREYQGVRKLNLRGSHNDPTMVREKLFYEVWQNAGMQPRRAAFVQLYINGLYRGLYTNIEELDKQWLSRVYGENDGNLYKCTWPADLAYLGENQATYKAIMNNPESRAYDLTTNETADDYTHLVDLIRTLNQPVDADYPAAIGAILNVESVLKAFALDVATDNWDDYFVNKNNYFLYDNPITGRFDFITFDTDNTFGVDWISSDWTKRNCLHWHTTFEPRPLATKLLAVPAFFNQYVHYLDSITRYIVHPDSIFDRIDHLHQLITPAAHADLFRTLDWGYTVSDFHNGFTQTIDGHTPYGIKPFLAIRHDSTLRQIAHLVSHTSAPSQQEMEVAIFPNPATEWVLLQPPADSPNEILFGLLQDCYGQTLQQWQWPAGSTYTLSLLNLPTGMYQIQLYNSNQRGHWLLIKN